MRRYLLVDDNVAFAENLAEILEAEGAMARVVSSPGEALAVLNSDPRFDAVVSDMRMPEMSGAQLLQQVREIDPALPAVVITAYTGDDDLRLARDQGLLAVLSKPVKPDVLTDTLARARRGGLVAVVEDDPALADNLTEALRTQGFATVTASNVLEAEKLSHLQPFCAVMDLRLPGGPDGAALDAFRRRFPQVPVFVVTAHADEATPPPCERLFVKPFSTPLLMDELERAFQRRAR